MFPGYISQIVKVHGSPVAQGIIVRDSNCFGGEEIFDVYGVANSGAWEFVCTVQVEAHDCIHSLLWLTAAVPGAVTPGMFCVKHGIMPAKKGRDYEAVLASMLRSWPPCRQGGVA